MAEMQVQVSSYNVNAQGQIVSSNTVAIAITADPNYRF